MENLTPPEPWNLYFPGVEYSSLVNSQPVNEIIELGTNYLSSSGAFNKVCFILCTSISIFTHKQVLLEKISQTI